MSQAQTGLDVSSEWTNNSAIWTMQMTSFC